MDLIFWKSCHSCRRIFNKKDMQHNILIGMHYPWSMCKDCYEDFITPKEEVNNEIKRINDNLKQFERIVGESPFDQIDWIIRHGLNEYFNWYMRCENGLIMYDNPIRIKQRNVETRRIVSSETVYACGGRGNSRLIGWSFERTYDIEED